MADTIPDLVSEFIKRVVTYTDEVTYFGENSGTHALATADGQLTAFAIEELLALERRYTVMGAAGQALVEAAEEFGTAQLGPQRARVLVVLRPWVERVQSIIGGVIEVADSSKFAAGDSIRIRSADGSVTETVTIASISTGSGPSSGDEINVGSLANVYSPGTENVSILLRKVLPAGTLFASEAGIAFQSLAAVTVADLNSVMDGESATLALNDKVWAEATVGGDAGNIGANTITGLQTPDADIKAALNPERAFGGAETERDFDLKRRATHAPSAQAQETQAFMEALAKQGNSDVLRVFVGTSSLISTIQVAVLTRNGGGLSSDARAALASFMSQRMRSQTSVEVVDVVPTSVEVTAEITLDPGTGTAADRLRAAWQAAADTIATFLDYRKWEAGTDVDEADLLSLVNAAPGVATVTTSTFLPAADVTVGDTSVPIFTRLVMTDTTSGETIGVDLTPEF